MIVFVADTDVRTAINNSGSDDTFVALGEVGQFPKYDYVSGIQFVPPPDAIYQLIDRGDKDSFVKDYLHYLSDPRVSYMLLASVLNAIENKSNVFFVFSKDDKENLGNFPKHLRRFLSDALYIDEGYITTYKKWNGKAGKISKGDYTGILNLSLQMSRKAHEALAAYGELG